MAYRDFDHSLFVQRFKRLRADAGLSQAKLGEYIGISASGIAHWEAFERTPTIETMIKLANFYDCTLEYILGISDFRHENEAIKYVLDKLVETGLVSEDGYLRQSVAERFIGYIKAFEAIPMK